MLSVSPLFDLSGKLCLYLKLAAKAESFVLVNDLSLRNCSVSESQSYIDKTGLLLHEARADIKDLMDEKKKINHTLPKYI